MRLVLLSSNIAQQSSKIRGRSVRRWHMLRLNLVLWCLSQIGEQFLQVLTSTAGAEWTWSSI